MSVTPEPRLLGTRYHWVYQGVPGEVFCVAFATSNRASLSHNGVLMGRVSDPSEWFPCSTFDRDGRGEVSVSLTKGDHGLLFGSLTLTGDRFHLDVYRLGPIEGTATAP